MGSYIRNIRAVSNYQAFGYKDDEGYHTTTCLRGISHACSDIESSTTHTRTAHQKRIPPGCHYGWHISGISQEYLRPISDTVKNYTSPLSSTEINGTQLLTTDKPHYLWGVRFISYGPSTQGGRIGMVACWNLCNQMNGVGMSWNDGCTIYSGVIGGERLKDWVSSYCSGVSKQERVALQERKETIFG